MSIPSLLIWKQDKKNVEITLKQMEEKSVVDDKQFAAVQSEREQEKENDHAMVLEQKREEYNKLLHQLNTTVYTLRVGIADDRKLRRRVH